MSLRRWLWSSLAALVLAGCSDSVGDRETGPDAATPTKDVFGALARREPNSCPTAAPLTQNAPGGAFTAFAGPVGMSFAPETVDGQSRVRADYSSRFDALVLKLPIGIRASPPTEVTIRGFELASGRAARYEDHNTEGAYVEVATFALTRPPVTPGGYAFVPGAMLFPEPGCYQIFVTVAGTEYGPFGLEIVNARG